MLTYQDYLTAKEQNGVAAFIERAINEHKASPAYQTAVNAEEYMRQQNTTIMSVRRLLYDAMGKAHVDTFSANYKVPSNFFKINITQLNQHLTANGVSFDEPTTKERLGGTAFDTALSKLSRLALVEGMSFGFLDDDQVRVFAFTEFCPLFDEEDGALKAGIRFWQLAANKPLRADLYDLDGRQSWIKRQGEELKPLDGWEQPKPYISIVAKAEADDEPVVEGINYATFPIVPCYGNYERQSELVGKRENIDAYDLIKSGLCNDIDDVQLIYWVLKNAGGMDELDLAYWRDSIRKNHVVKTDDNVDVDMHTTDVPYGARDSVLDRLERDICRDAMALDTRQLATGNVTATAIEAASKPLNNRADELEYCLIEFIQGLLALVGIQDMPHFNRAEVVNALEVTQTVMMAADLLDEDTMRRKLPWLTPEECDAIPDKLAGDAVSRIDYDEDETPTEGATTEAVE